jgi:membrane-associated phospholipid phosphatase
MSFTAALTAHLLGLARRLRIALWAWLAVTALGTVYLGWHYVLDDVGGIALGALALALGAVLSGVDLRSARRARESSPRQAAVTSERRHGAPPEVAVAQPRRR